MHRSLLLVLSSVLFTSVALVSTSLAVYDQSSLDRSKQTQRVIVGKFQSRGLWTAGEMEKPAILMLPGSGAQGPEEMIPANMSADGKDCPVFNQLARPFIERGFNVLQLGKPGVDFFERWPVSFYDQIMYDNRSWNDLIENAKAGLEFLRRQSTVSAREIYVLGHSEGTQLAVDVAALETDIKGLILLGYSAKSLLATLHWQLYERSVEHFVKPDVDANHDGYVTRAEAKAWPEFFWPFENGENQVSIEDIRAKISADPRLSDFIDRIRDSRFCEDGHCSRKPIYKETLKFPGNIYIFTGELDLQTRANEALTLKRKCDQIGRTNCFVEIIPGVQHSFNLPKPPRRHPLLDIAVAPVENSFLERLKSFAKQLEISSASELAQ